MTVKAGWRKERRRENGFIVICCLLRIILFIIMLFIQGHITMAHTLQAVWFLKGTLNIESNQVKQSQHTRRRNVAPPNRQPDAVITFSTSQICCRTNDPTQSLTTYVLLMGELNLMTVIRHVWSVCLDAAAELLSTEDEDCSFITKFY